MDELPHPHSKASFIRIVGIFLIGAILGVFFGYWLGERSLFGTSDNALLHELFGDINPTVFSGKIVAIHPEKASLTLTVLSVQGVRLPQAYQTKQIALRPDTKITTRIAKNREAFQKEVEALYLANKGPIPMPPPYKEQKISIRDLHVGDAITVFVVPRGKQTVLDTEFTASSINVNR